LRAVAFLAAGAVDERLSTAGLALSGNACAFSWPVVAGLAGLLVKQGRQNFMELRPMMNCWPCGEWSGQSVTADTGLYLINSGAAKRKFKNSRIQEFIA
jgi:hypothetical protein